MLFNLANISFRYGEQAILEGLTTRMTSGQHVAIVGPNGCGKTTFIKTLTGTMEPDDGTVQRLKGLDILSLDQIAPPEGEETVRAYVARGLEAWQVLETAYQQAMSDLAVKPDDPAALELFGQAESAFLVQGGHAFPARLDAALTHLGLTGHADEPAAWLSGGQRHRCRLARLLLTPADLWILDEPTNHLDDDGIDWLVQLLAQC